jgi:hypothetical protein
MSGLLDIVYMVKAGEDNEPLRHSLRSLVNLPHGRVWIVGYKPRWLHGVCYIPTMQRGAKHSNTWRNWDAMATTPQMPDRFVLFNDDFYVTRPIEQVPNLHRGLLDDAIAWLANVRSPAYRIRMEATRRVLRRAGVAEPFYSYELHAPMVMDRAIHAESLRWLKANQTAPLDSMAKRSFYGNWAQAGGEQAHDVKVMKASHGMPESPLPFLSTSTDSWAGLAGGWVRRQFDVPSVYETRGDTKYRPPMARSAQSG